MNQNIELTLEQEFKLQVLKKDVSELNKAQAQDLFTRSIIYSKQN